MLMNHDKIAKTIFLKLNHITDTVLRRMEIDGEYEKIACLCNGAMGIAPRSIGGYGEVLFNVGGGRCRVWGGGGGERSITVMR